MSLFSADNKVIQFLDTFFDYVCLQLLTLAFCIPVITAGAAYTAKYYTAMKLARGESPDILQAFLRSFRQNLRQGILLELAAIPAYLLLILDWYLVCSTDFGVISYILLSIMLVVTVVVTMMTSFAFPLLSRFHSGTVQIIKNAFLIGTGKFWVSIFFVLCSVVLAAACLIWIIYGAFIWLLAGAGLLWVRSLVLTKVLKEFE